MLTSTGTAWTTTGPQTARHYKILIFPREKYFVSVYQVFQGTPCLNQCPRVMLESTGLALDNKENLLGCFRLQGSKVGNTLVEYQNMNRFYLTPDAFSTMFISHWLISEQKNPINGGIKNEK